MKEESGNKKLIEEEQASRIAYLIAGYLQHRLSEVEHDELDEWVGSSDENMLLFEKLTDKDTIEEGLREMKGYDARKAIESIRRKISSGALVKPRKRHYWAWSIAASVLIIAGIFLIRTYHDKAPKQVIVKADLLPGGNRASLTLSDGSNLDLTEAKTGMLKDEKGILVNKAGDGQLNYTATANADSGTRYNVLTTPRGGQYKVELADGTKVWLNAASSLKYPLTFTAGRRTVALTGEGYFEVAKDSLHPFEVKLGNEATIEVTGTHFNINAYNDEGPARVTLLEGGVTVRKIDAGEGVGTPDLTIIHPGQQALLAYPVAVTSLSQPALEEIMGWKNGLFQFRDQTIQSIMRQVSRWYDVEIVYEGQVNDHFNVTSIPRNVAVSRLFNLLAITGRVHFAIQGKKIIVTP